MSKDVVCNYCREDWWNDKKICIYNDRKLFEFDLDHYTYVGTHVRINHGNEMETFAVIVAGRQSHSQEAKFKINFCPMCGRELKESEEDSSVWI